MPDSGDYAAELQRHPFMAGMAPELIERMAGCVIGTTRWEEDEVIFRSGGAAERCYLVLSGEIALEVYSPGSRPRIVLTISRGEVLGWSWLFEPYRWAFDAKVMTPAEALVLDGEAIRNCIVEHKDLGYEVMSRFARLIVDRLQATRLQLLDFYASNT
jgi:CRP-like cAMP-binding protein